MEEVGSFPYFHLAKELLSLSFRSIDDGNGLVDACRGSEKKRYNEDADENAREMYHETKFSHGSDTSKLVHLDINAPACT